MKIIKTFDIKQFYFDDTVENIINQLQELKDEYSGYDNLRIDEEYVGDGGYYHYLKGERLETDAEEALREKNDAEYQKRTEESQRKQYELLKAKFEPEK